MFVALDPALSVVRSVSEVQSKLKPYADSLKWMRPESMYLTLKFLEEVSPPRLRAVEHRLEAIRRPAFKVSVSGVGFFPDTQSPQVLWTGVSSTALARLAGEVDRQMVALNFPPEYRKFMPHLTLASSRRLEN